MNPNDLFFLNEYELPALIRNNVKVEWVNLGEGFNGDYDSGDPEDKNLLRFDFSHLVGDSWEPVDDGSYCTRISAETKRPVLNSLLASMMNETFDHISNHGRAKRICESLSWIIA